MSVKKFVGQYNIINWIKGAILVIFGTFGSRFDVSFELFQNNLIFGPISYLPIVFSAMLIVLILKLPEKELRENPSKIKKISIISVVSLLLGYGISIIYIIYGNLPLIGIILLATFSLILLFCMIYGRELKYQLLISKILISLTLTIALLYGTLLNDISIPLWVYFFLMVIFSLQLSKELLKSYRNVNIRSEIGENREESIDFLEVADDIEIKNIRMVSLLLQVVALLCIVLPYLISIYNSFLYLISMLIYIVFSVISIGLTIAFKLEEKYHNSIFVLNRGLMFCGFLAIFLGTF